MVIALIVCHLALGQKGRTATVARKSPASGKAKVAMVRHAVPAHLRALDKVRVKVEQRRSRAAGSLIRCKPRWASREWGSHVAITVRVGVVQVVRVGVTAADRAVWVAIRACRAAGLAAKSFTRAPAMQHCGAQRIRLYFRT